MRAKEIETHANRLKMFPEIVPAECNFFSLKTYFGIVRAKRNRKRAVAETEKAALKETAEMRANSNWKCALGMKKRGNWLPSSYFHPVLAQAIFHKSFCF